jgi:hypothetical protein
MKSKQDWVVIRDAGATALCLRCGKMASVKLPMPLMMYVAAMKRILQTSPQVQTEMTRLFVVPTKQTFQKRRATTVQLTLAQRILLSELQLKRMTAGKRKPTITQMVSEGLALLFRREKIKENP